MSTTALAQTPTCLALGAGQRLEFKADAQLAVNNLMHSMGCVPGVFSQVAIGHGGGIIATSNGVAAVYETGQDETISIPCSELMNGFRSIMDGCIGGDHITSGGLLEADTYGLAISLNPAPFRQKRSADMDMAHDILPIAQDQPVGSMPIPSLTAAAHLPDITAAPALEKRVATTTTTFTVTISQNLVSMTVEYSVDTTAGPVIDTDRIRLDNAFDELIDKGISERTLIGEPGRGFVLCVHLRQNLTC
jgi:hypothetical protein